MLGGRALAYEGSAGAPAGRYRAQTLLENPQSQAYMGQQFNKNKPIADEVFGRNVDLMGRPRGGKPSFTGRTPVEVNLDKELNAIANTPRRPAVTALDKLMEQPAFEGLPQGEIAMPKAAPRPSRARPVAPAKKPGKAGAKSPSQLANEEALARRRKK
jgi:hypothetical protein